MKRNAALTLAILIGAILSAGLVWFLVTADESEKNAPQWGALPAAEHAPSDALRTDRTREPSAPPITAERPSSTDPSASVQRRDENAAPLLHGITQDAAGVPVPGAKLVAEGRDGQATYFAETSDERGQFKIERSDRWANLGAIAAGFEPSNLHVFPFPAVPDDDQPIILTLYSGGGTLRGVVRSSDGEALTAAIEVKVASTLPYRKVPKVIGHSRPDGNFEITGLPCTDLVVCARAEGYATQWTTTHIASAGEAYVELHLTSPAEAYGRVVSSDGQPIAGATILGLPRVFPHEQFDIVSARSEADGTYKLSGLQPGEFRLRVNAATHDSVDLVRYANAGERIEWNPVLQKGQSLRARLFERDGQPAVGWKVSARDPRQSTNPAQTTTDHEGLFEINGMQEWGYTLLFFEPESKGSLPLFHCDDVRATASEQRFQVPAATSELTALSGSLRGEDLQALSVTPAIRLTREPSGVTNATWDASSEHFEFQALPPGSYLLRISAAGYADHVQRIVLEGRDLKLDPIALSRGSSLHVKVEPAASIPMIFGYLYDDRQRHRWMAQVNGERMDFPPVPAGKYVLRIEPRPYSHEGQLRYHSMAGTDRHIELVDGADQTVEITIRAAQRVRFQFASAASVQRSELRLHDAADQTLRSASITRYGSQALEAVISVPIGTWVIEAQHDDGQRARLKFECAAIEATERTIEVPLAKN